jgi:hypothetical protein
MPSVERFLEYPVNLLGDVIRIRFCRSAGLVEQFTVQLEVSIDGELIPAVRWDTAHGFAHRDHLLWNGETDHWDRMRAENDFAVSLTEAIKDAKENWERYRSDFLRRKLRT